MRRKTIRVLLLLACTALFYAGCQETGGISEKPYASQPATAEVDIDALFEAALPGPELPPDEMPDEPICTDYASRGLLRICYTNDSDAALKLQVLKGDESIAYNLKGDGSLEDFSLQYGDGEYTARIMQNIEDDKYFAVEAKTFTVTIDHENDVYLNSIQNIDWDYERMAIQAVKAIVAESLINQEEPLYFSCTQDLYDYIVRNIDYDNDKIFNLLYDYLPDIDETYLSGKGICYDYSSLMAAMLRSINIPAKLVKGYASYSPDVYHAWNEVFVNGKWHVIDATKDASERSSAMDKNSDDYKKVYEY